MSEFSTVEEAIEAIRKGQVVIVADNEDRENEGDLICAAETITPEIINFMATEARGLICLPITQELASKLNLNAMSSVNTDTEETAFTVSIDGIPDKGITTGISAKDRANTIKLCLEKNTQPDDLRRPGHVFPLIARDGGVLVRQGQTEAAVDLASLAGLNPAGVICEIANPDGSMARRDELFTFAKKHDLPFITVEQIINYRIKNEFLLNKEAKAKLPTKYGEFALNGYTEKYGTGESLALIHGNIDTTKPVLVRIHSECLTGDALSSLRCDCQDQLQAAQKQIVDNKSGIIIYLRQEGRGIGLMNKLKAYELQDQENLDTFEANNKLGFQDDLRSFWNAAQILRDLNIKTIDLITNNPDKIKDIEQAGIQVNQRIASIHKNGVNNEYLESKKLKEHLL